MWASLRARKGNEPPQTVLDLSPGWLFSYPHNCRPLRCQHAVAQQPWVAAEHHWQVLRTYLLNCLSDSPALAEPERRRQKQRTSCLWDGWGLHCRKSCLPGAVKCPGQHESYPKTLRSLSFGTFTSFPKTKILETLHVSILENSVCAYASLGTHRMTSHWTSNVWVFTLCLEADPELQRPVLAIQLCLCDPE